MILWIDGDSCPRDLRRLVNTRCRKLNLSLCYVANSPLQLPDSPCITQLLSSKEKGSADEILVQKAQKGDLVITRDIPLAARLVEKGITVINDRGRLFNAQNIKEFLDARDFSLMMKDAGILQEQSRNYGFRELKAFTSCFEKEVMRLLREERFRKISRPGETVL
ncbi:MAG: YaiI/YqxD family protein [Deltaproteobacteria bacterium]|nr:MAG: YaiI/YqxD family protein [Deltaproteobacteria bacterium]